MRWLILRLSIGREFKGISRRFISDYRIRWSEVLNESIFGIREVCF